MFGFLRRGKPRERLASSFRWLDRKIFPETETQWYSARHERGSFRLELRKESYFAWETMVPERRFTDFVLEADLEADPGSGHSALGVILRHVNDENFYFFLISSRGNYRFDLLFNNHPQHLIEWTRLPAPDGLTRRLSLVAHGSHFSFVVDDEWVGEIDDEVLPAGGIGFAAQTFQAATWGSFHLRRLLVTEQPLEVEREHLRWTYFFPASQQARVRLAETFFSMGSFTGAAVQLRRALKNREGTPAEHFLLAESYAQLSLLPEALSEIDTVLRMEPGHLDARRERPNLLYLSNRVLEARDEVRRLLADETVASGSATWNLLGNAEYALGNWAKASEAYLRACELQPDQQLFQENAARSLEKEGRTEEARDLYLKAARALFAEETFDELSLLLPRLSALDPGNPEARSLEARMLYREGKTQEAHRILQLLAEEGKADSTASYLLGIILTAQGRREEALPHLERAAEAEPAFPLYQFRLAENLHMLGRDPGNVLDAALALAPDDPWTNNLAGMIRLEKGDPGGAIAFLTKARGAAPSEADIALNLSEALSRDNKHDEALLVLDEMARATGESAALANQRGNIRVRMGDHAAAVTEYESAIRLDPENPVYKENGAAACIEIDMVHRAEELLGQIEQEHPSASVYNLIGNVAVLKGELMRAEMAYSAGLRLEANNADIKVNLAMVHLQRNDYANAKEMLLNVLAENPSHARAARVLERARSQRETLFSCAQCGRQWWAPKDLPAQPGLKIRGEPPGEAPAGRCPKCGKVSCVRCASEHVQDMRFVCRDCGEVLKLSEDSLKWLLAQAIDAQAKEGEVPSGP
ncbi:MAG TPA: tetratricopeptide repeat protein [Spirochaetia bacterium]|nr:tetratricopeptide repeat protein [Spirochaetia bacterium]